jgi:soluble lytic murein transglycosylase
MIKRSSFLRCILVVSLFIIYMFTFDVPRSLAGDNALDTVEKAVRLMHDNEFNKAEQMFSEVISDDFIINDFAILWRAQSYAQQGKTEEALSDIRTIKKRYRKTAAFRNALRLELEISGKNREERSEVMSLFESYLTLYPRDREVRYEYAGVMRDYGYIYDAFQMFKKLYIQADDFSEEAALEFDTDVLQYEEFLKRGNALLKKWEFIKAETEFKKALELAPESHMEELKEKIAYCTFRQKNYEKAARLYSEVNDRYMEAVSHLRSGNRKSFIRAIDQLRAMKDPRMGVLLIALANEKRRSGDYYNAITTLNNAIESSPFKEDILWQIGWTQYSMGNHLEAESIFNDLNDEYRSNRYVYWMLRSRERMAQQVTDDFRKLCEENDYYGFLACLKTGMNIRKIDATFDTVHANSPLLKRFGVLKKLGFKEEALFELNRLIRSLRKPSQIMLYSKKLQEIGEYKKAISVATMVPYSDRVHDLVYPVAYWDVIKDISRRFSIDPVYILSIAREESRLDPEARSVAGALGLMQLMPSTAERICRKIKCALQEEDPFFDVETNITVGSFYLKTLLDRFRSIPVATAAYNAGENAVKRWMDIHKDSEPDEFIEEIPYPETRRYVKKVLTTFFQYSRYIERPENSNSLQRNISFSSSPPRLLFP